jgi:hypothetical protein
MRSKQVILLATKRLIRRRREQIPDTVALGEERIALSAQTMLWETTARRRWISISHSCLSSMNNDGILRLSTMVETDFVNEKKMTTLRVRVTCHRLQAKTRSTDRRIEKIHL